MAKANLVKTNTAGGELSPAMRGRIGLPVYDKGLALCLNFICMAQGGARYRQGTAFVKNTRLNQTAMFIPFQFNDSQAYLIEATHLKFRFFKDNGAVLESSKTITGVTQASPGVVTSASHGFSNGDEVFIDSIVGMTRLNGRYFLVAGATANTFTLTDLAGNAIDTSAFTAYSSGGTVSRVYEIASPYEEVDLPYLQWTQNADTMYITHQNYAPGKLTRTGHTSWTLNNAYTRIADPFTAPTKTITAVSQANPGVVTSAAHGMVNGTVLVISGIVGMTQLNGNRYKVANVTTNTFTLQTLAGVNVDTTSYTAYSSGGTATLSTKYPRACTFTDTGRLLMAGTWTNPETVYGSKAPTTAGVTAFDDFTVGSGATDAVTFTFAPAFGRVDAIQWLANTSKAVVAGTFGAIRRMYGATEQEPLSPTSVTAKTVNGNGCSYSLPVANGNTLFYIKRGDKSVRSLEYDISIDGYDTTDRNLVSEHLTKPGVKQIIEQQANPDVIWTVRNDGRLLGLTYKSKEDISGWHQHKLGGRHTNSNSVSRPFGKTIAVGRMPRPGNDDQLWLIVERVVNGATVRSVEYLTDEPLYPLREDFYTSTDEDDADEESDTNKFHNAMFEAQKDAVHLDMSSSYDGSAYGTAASASLTPGAGATVSGTTGVTFTASASVFTSTMVGRELWKKYDENGEGGGRAVITGYASATQVTCTITQAFDSISAIAAGRWFLTTDTVNGLDYLNGETVYITADGAVESRGATVASGSVSIQSQASKITVGYPYKGIIETLNLDIGGTSGPAQAKTRTLVKAAFRFLNSLGVRFGTNIYGLQTLEFRFIGRDEYGRPSPLYTGVQEDKYNDSYEAAKKIIYVVQDVPVPCTLLSIDATIKTTDE